MADNPHAQRGRECDYGEGGDCWNCGGEGFVYGCSWDWQCDTYDEGEGTCLCTRRCDWCNPHKPTAETEAHVTEHIEATANVEPDTQALQQKERDDG